jgi:hypothetical protein
VPVRECRLSFEDSQRFGSFKIQRRQRTPERSRLLFCTQQVAGLCRSLRASSHLSEPLCATKTERQDGAPNGTNYYVPPWHDRATPSFRVIRHLWWWVSALPSITMRIGRGKNSRGGKAPTPSAAPRMFAKSQQTPDALVRAMVRVASEHSCEPAALDKPSVLIL